MCGCDVRLINADGSVIPFPFPVSSEEFFAGWKKQLEDFIRITQSEIGYDDINE
jgi:hypothetical protein